MSTRVVPLLRLFGFALLVGFVGSVPSFGAEPLESWRALAVRVTDARGNVPLTDATVTVEVVGAPVWDAAHEVRVGADGSATIWIPRWGGPVVVTARAAEHLPARSEVGPEGVVSLRLPSLPRTQQLRLGLVDDRGRGVSPLAIPEHATLVVRAFGDRVDEERFAQWTFPARPAFLAGIDLPAGTCELCLQAPAWVPDWTRFVLPSSVSVTIPLPARAVQPLLVEIIDAASGTPVPGALVHYGGWGEGQVRADGAGRLSIPYLPGDRLPEAVTLDWSHPGWARTRWYTPRTGADGRVTWQLGMHRAPDVRVPVREATGVVTEVGVAWSIGGAWPTQRRRIAGGVAAVPLPAAGEDGDLRYAFASKRGFRVVDAAALRSGETVVLASWRRIRGTVDRAGEPCPGSCQVGVHLLPPLPGALDPTDLPPWAWTADISAGGLIDTVVPEDAGCVLQVDVGRRTAFFRASDLWDREAPVLRLGPETESAPRTLRLLSANGDPIPEADVELRWYSPSARPQPVDLAYRGKTDAEGYFRHYGPAGPYSVVVSLETGLHAPNVDLRYVGDVVAELRVPAAE